jgi:co-chaperonin GroES (HSP10)
MSAAIDMGALRAELADAGYDVAESRLDPMTVPRPVLWRLVIEPIQIQDRTKGGIVLPEEVHRIEQLRATVGRVVAMAPGAYQHPKFTGCEPACAVGDWVQYQSFSGITTAALDRDGREVALRIINDDEICARPRERMVAHYASL